MIRRISIKNYAIIDELEFSPSASLNVISGETGAGKSIILGALELILGARADLDILYNKEEKCIVEGEFDISGYELEAFFRQRGLDYYPSQLILRREILPAGRSRAFVNDSPVKLDIMQELQKSLVDLHRQFSTLDLNERSFQERMLDSFAGNKVILKDYRQLYHNWKELQSRLEDLKREEAESRKEEDYLTFQLNELEKLDPRPGEEEELEWQLKQMEHAEEIKQGVDVAINAISESDMPILSTIRELAQDLGSMAEFLKSLESYSQRLHSIAIELQDISDDLSAMNEDIQYDPERMEELRSRNDELQALLFKHQLQTSEELISLREKIESKLKKSSSLSEEIKALEEALQKVEMKLQNTGLALRESREDAREEFSMQVISLLKDLSMPDARFLIELVPLDDFGPNGMDKIEFLFSANAGSEPGKVKNVASGGELSRLALCIKHLVAGKTALPTMIFDEIDSGVSGDVALKMGHILSDMATRHQIIVITHAPQIAALGESHYFVYKEKDDKQTYTRIKLLEGRERVISIASMLSSNPPSKAAISNAKDLLNKNT